MKVSATGPSTPIAPIRSSFARVVVAVAEVAALVLVPVPVAVLSSAPVFARPENSFALSPRPTLYRT